MAEKLDSQCTLYSLFAPILTIGDSDHNIELSSDNLFEYIDEEKVASIRLAEFDRIIEVAYIFTGYTEEHVARLKNLRHTVKNRKSSQRSYQKQKLSKGGKSSKKE